MTKSEIFKAAWIKAKETAWTFGGSSRDYFPSCLKVVYADIAYNKQAAATRKANIDSNISKINAICNTVKTHKDADSAIKQISDIRVKFGLYPVQVKSKVNLAAKKEIVASARDDVLTFLNKLVLSTSTHYSNGVT